MHAGAKNLKGFLLSNCHQAEISLPLAAAAAIREEFRAELMQHAHSAALR